MKFTENETLKQILEEYQDTNYYHDFEEAWSEFKTDYSEELKKAGITAENLASDILSYWYSNYGFKTRIVVEDRPTDGNGDIFTSEPFETEAEAISEALNHWHRLTYHERKNITLEVIRGSYDAKGNFDTESVGIDILWSSDNAIKDDNTLKIYSAEVFRDMVLDYINDNYDEYHDLIIDENDPTQGEDGKHRYFFTVSYGHIHVNYAGTK